MSVEFNLSNVNSYVNSYSAWYNEIDTHFSKIEQSYSKARDKVVSVLSQLNEDLIMADKEKKKCDNEIYENRKELESQKECVHSCKTSIELLEERKQKRDEAYAEGKPTGDFTNYDIEISIQENQIKTCLKRIAMHSSNIANLTDIITYIENDITKMESCQSKLEIQKNQIDNVLDSLREVGYCLNKIANLKQYIENNIYPVMRKIALLQSNDGSVINETKIENIEIFKDISNKLETTSAVLNENVRDINDSAIYLRNIISDNKIEESSKAVYKISSMIEDIKHDLENKCKNIDELQNAVKEYMSFANKSI